MGNLPCLLGLKLRSSWSLPPEELDWQVWATVPRLVWLSKKKLLTDSFIHFTFRQGLNSLCSPDWPQICDPPVSASWIERLQALASTPGSLIHIQMYTHKCVCYIDTHTHTHTHSHHTTHHTELSSFLMDCARWSAPSCSNLFGTLAPILQAQSCLKSLTMHSLSWGHTRWHSTFLLSSLPASECPVHGSSSVIFFKFLCPLSAVLLCKWPHVQSCSVGLLAFPGAQLGVSDGENLC
jgi:hypothetical protein